jgi:dethiobiotin synthetase
MKGILITGTDTGVGKTFITYHLAKELRERGINAGCFKPVETGVDGVPEDGYLLAKATGQRVEEVVPFTSGLPLAPYSAILEGELTLRKEDIIENFRKLSGKYEVVLVEGAGGVAVPILEDYTYGDLARELNLNVLIVARATLGTINHSVLTVEYLRGKNVPIIGLILNGFRGQDPSERTNPEVIYQMTGLKPLCIRWAQEGELKKEESSALADLIGL